MALRDVIVGCDRPLWQRITEMWLAGGLAVGWAYGLGQLPGLVGAVVVFIPLLMSSYVLALLVGTVLGWAIGRPPMTADAVRAAVHRDRQARGLYTTIAESVASWGVWLLCGHAAFAILALGQSPLTPFGMPLALLVWGGTGALMGWTDFHRPVPQIGVHQPANRRAAAR